MKALINVILSCTKPSQKRTCLRMIGIRYWRSHLKCHISWRTCASAAGLQLVSLLEVFWELTSPVGGVLIGSNLQWGWFRLFHQHFFHDIQILPTRDWKSTASQLKCSDSNQPYVRLIGIVIVTEIHHFWSSSPVVVTDDDEEIQFRVSSLKMLCSCMVPSKASNIWGRVFLCVQIARQSTVIPYLCRFDMISWVPAGLLRGRYVIIDLSEPIMHGISA